MRRYVAAVDLFLNAMVVFLIAVILMLPLLNPPTENEQADPVGTLSIYAAWGAGDYDVDLWVLAPGEPRAVGYSRKSGKSLDLLRDDLGNVSDRSPANYENVVTRGLIPGEYVANLHAYRVAALPQDVFLEVTININGRLLRLVTATVTLTKQGQELTAIRFYLEEDGTIRPGSMHAVFKPLRSAKP